MSLAPRTQLQTLSRALVAREQSALALLSTRYFRASEAAAALNVAIPTIRKWIADGHLQAVRTGRGRWRISESEILRLGGKS